MWQAGEEALGMLGVGRGEHGRSRRDALLGHAMVHVGGRQQAEAGVMMLGVVPREEDVAVGAGVLDRAEPLAGAWIETRSPGSATAAVDG